jgi:Domain of unknown function (DUF4386)
MNTNIAMVTNVSTKRIRMSSLRKTSLVSGILYLLTFVSIPTLLLYASIREPNYVLGAGPDTAVIFGAILEIIVALANIGTAVVLYPVLRKQNEGIALGFVGSRILEAVTIFIGAVFILSIVTLRHTGIGEDALVTSQTLVIMYDRIFLIGQSFMPVVNALLLGSILYRSQMVPRVLPVIGFIGAAVLVICDTAVLFSFINQRDPRTALAAIPIALWEFSLGIYLITKGFKPSLVPRNT